MIFKKIFFIFIFSSIFAVTAQGSSGKPEKHVLKNGLTVLIQEFDSSPSVCLYALVKTGSASEGQFLGSGVTHFMEHMIFKGTPSRLPGRISQEVQGAGGSINASTGRDYTIFTIQVPADRFETGLDVLSDMLMHAVIDEEEFRKEKDVVLSELNMYEDSPDFIVSRMMLQALYKKHPYRHPIIGYRDVLKNLQQKDMVQYYQKHYAPNNIVLSVVGNIQSAAALEKVKSAFVDFKRQPEIARNLPKEPEQLFARYSKGEYQTDLTRIDMAFPTASLLSEDVFALDILVSALGVGESSRLYLDLFKQKNLVYSISANHYTLVDSGILEIEAKCDYKNKDAVVENIRLEIERIRRFGIRADELKRIKKKIKSDYYLDHQSAPALAFSLAYDEGMADDYHFSQHYLDRIEKLTQKDIKEVAQKYLDPEKENLAILAPLNSGESVLVKDELRTEMPAIKEVVLANGLRIFVKEDHRFPVVSMNAFFEGGQFFDSQSLSGICYLTSKLLNKGTKKRTASDISQELEAQGIRLDTFCDKNILGLSFECLSQDFSVGLNLAKDILFNPTFSEDELQQQKDVVVSEIKAKKDNIFYLASKELKEILFKGHPFQNETEGSFESIKKITRLDIEGFYQNLRAPSRMVVTVFGDIREDEAIQMVKKTFGTLLENKSELPQHTVESVAAKTVKNVTFDKNQAIVLMGFQGVGASYPDRWGINALSALIGSFNGKMFHDIRDEYGWAYSLGGRSVEFKDTGFIYFYVLTDQQHVRKAQQEMEGIILSIQEGSVTPEELDKIKNHLKETYQAQLETNRALSSRVAVDEIYGLGFDNFRKHEKLIDQITLKDIQRLAKEYLDLNRAVIILGNAKE
ncbi:MAG: pitrilysin family protein [Candidatus Omnitrophica bacterium]|nr:pitrilysin family protein [Candidatus Omnitrophota bacterium]